MVNIRARSFLSLLERRRDQTTWIVRLYLASVSPHNTSFLWLIFVFRYASGEIEAQKSRERSGESSKGMFLRCLRIELLQKNRRTQVKIQIVCERR
jgi:hypothetical protein